MHLFFLHFGQRGFLGGKTLLDLHYIKSHGPVEPIRVLRQRRRFTKKISGVLSCFDRLIITGTLPQICYAQGMTSYLCGQGERIFDYPKFAEPFKNQLRANAQQIAKDNNIEIEFVAKSHIRKEDLVKKVLDKKGIHTGLVYIISAMEACSSYKPWHDKESGKTFLKG